MQTQKSILFHEIRRAILQKCAGPYQNRAFGLAATIPRTHEGGATYVIRPRGRGLAVPAPLHFVFTASFHNSFPVYSVFF